MNIEQRLTETLDAARRYKPSPDLWDRVVHSIDEDRQHRRRIWTTIISISAAVLIATVVCIASLERSPMTQVGTGYRLNWRVLQALEFVLLATLVAVLGPNIRRFGRGYVTDILHSSPATGARLLGLLDTAYYLVFSGYLLVTVRLVEPSVYAAWSIGQQGQESALRIGGLLLVMGLLHGATLVVMPLVGLVFNATRAGRKLPRWVNVILILVAAQIVMNLPALLLLGSF